MVSFNELIDADLFSDILEQAKYLLSEGYLRASVVVAGVALESHLRKLADKNSILIKDINGKYVKAETLNNLLYEKGIVDKSFHKSITAWLGLRNEGAHPGDKDITSGLIEPMIQGILVLIEKYPA